MCASTLLLYGSSSCTRNMAFGSGSVTVPSTSIASFFGKLRVFLDLLRHAVSPCRRVGTTSGRRRPVSIGDECLERHDQRKRVVYQFEGQRIWRAWASVAYSI